MTKGTSKKILLLPSNYFPKLNPMLALNLIKKIAQYRHLYKVRWKTRQIYRSITGASSRKAQKTFSAKPKVSETRYKQSLGEVLSFDNVPIVPYEYLLEMDMHGFLIHKGGPIWPDWSNQLDARHCQDGKPCDEQPDIPKQIERYIYEPAAWCGPILHHFGHQIADFSTRILHISKIYPDAKLLFFPYSTDIKRPNFSTLTAILNWYGIDANKIEIITQPTFAKNLLVAPQAEQLMNYGPSSEYLDLLDENTERQLHRKPKQKAVFVSRAGMLARFAGETYLEGMMKKMGIRVIRPETMLLEQQLAEYEASEHLIFSEGSALHALQLLGRSIDHVNVLVRRPRKRLAENLLTRRVQSLSYVEVSHGVVCGLWPNGQLRRPKGICILNEDAIIDYLCLIDSSIKQHWNQTEYLEARDNDILSWLKDTELDPTITQIPTEKDVVIQTLQEVKLDHLIPMAERFL